MKQNSIGQAAWLFWWSYIKLYRFEYKLICLVY
jgi:hypothetical protein